MATVFHATLYGRLTEIKSNLRRKKLHIANQGSYLIGGGFSNRDSGRAPLQFKRERQSLHLKKMILLQKQDYPFSHQ